MTNRVALLVILFFRRIASILCVTVTIAALSEELCSTGSLSSEEEVEFIKRSDSLAMRNKRAIKTQSRSFQQLVATKQVCNLQEQNS